MLIRSLVISQTDYILGTCLRQGLAELKKQKTKNKEQKTKGHLESA
jgi:hypothetical protein